MNKSFLKWAGGKSKVLPYIKELLPIGNRLVEPFCGSGIVTLNTNFSQYLINDINPDVTNIFTLLQQTGISFVNECKKYFVPDNNTNEQYGILREIFNTTKDTTIRAALFIYLNRHCFNGLCRYNRSGKFNVPFGRYNKPYFPEREMLTFIERSKNITIMNIDFRLLRQFIQMGDVVYCDPPYVSLSDTANFTSYTKEGFNTQCQEDLVQMVNEYRGSGIHFLISNHDTEETRELYKNASTIISFNVQRNISSDASNRNKAKELIALF